LDDGCEGENLKGVFKVSVIAAEVPLGGWSCLDTVKPAATEHCDCIGDEGPGWEFRLDELTSRASYGVIAVRTAPVFQMKLT
jgi:hypothetical protein